MKDWQREGGRSTMVPSVVPVPAWFPDLQDRIFLILFLERRFRIDLKWIEWVSEFKISTVTWVSVQTVAGAVITSLEEGLLTCMWLSCLLFVYSADHWISTVEAVCHTNELGLTCLPSTPHFWSRSPFDHTGFCIFHPTFNKHTITGSGDSVAHWYRCECGLQQASQSLGLIGINQI